MTNRMGENSAGDGRGLWLNPRSLCLRGARPYWFQTELGKAWSNDLFLQWENGPRGSWRSACQASYCSGRLLSMPDLSWAGHSHIPNAGRPGTPEVHTVGRDTGENSLHLQPVGLSDWCIIEDPNGVLFSAHRPTPSAQRTKWPWQTHAQPQHWVLQTITALWEKFLLHYSTSQTTALMWYA